MRTFNSQKSTSIPTISNRKVLCPALFNRLQEVFGKVEIANEGQSMSYRTVPSVLSTRAEPVSSVEVYDSGEQYRVNCPFCGDTRRRLYISYKWYDMPYRAICFNENCLKNIDHYQTLHKCIRRLGVINFTYYQDEVKEPEDYEPKEIGFNGRLVSLFDPSAYMALSYLENERGFDAETLEKDYSVSYCADVFSSEIYPAKDRIFIPHLIDGKLFGYNCRLPYEVDRKNRIKKYFNCPGFKTSQTFYNLDRSSQKDFVVIVEGVTSVWRIGPEAAACYKGSLSGKQKQIVISKWLSKGGDVFFLFDPDKKETTLKHFQEFEAIFPGQVGYLILPDNTDPATFSTPTIRHMIREAAIKFNLKKAINL